MKTRSKNRTFARWTACLVVAFVSTSLAAAAQAGIFFDHIPPTVCKSSSRSFTGERVEYKGGAIGVESSSSNWNFDFVVCPISRFRPGDEVAEIRIGMEGDHASSGWCRMYDVSDHDTQVDFQYPSRSGFMHFDPPNPEAANGMVGLTASCLVFPGTSITSISIVWDL